MLPALARPERRVLLGFGLSSLGNGLTLPFLYVYLAQVRDLGPTTAGWLFAWMGVAGVLVTPVIGALMDRCGPRAVMIGGLGVEVVAVGCLGHVSGLLPLMAVLAAVVAGAAPLWPGTTAMLARLVPVGDHERAFGMAFLGINAGLGVGGLAGAALVDVSDVSTFQLLYALDAVSYASYALVLLSLPRSTGRAASRVPGEPDRDGNWREVLADRRALALLGVGVLAVTFGYAQLEAGATAYAIEVAGIAAPALGWAFAANTVVIVVGQLLALRLVASWRRTTALAVAVGTWSLAWAVVSLSGFVPAGSAVAAVVVGLAIFGLGETLWTPIATALMNALATERLRGRYNTALGLVWTLGQVFGPAVAGLLIGGGHGFAWAAVVVGGTALAAVLMLSLRRLFAPAEDGIPAREPAAVSVP